MDNSEERRVGTGEIPDLRPQDREVAGIGSMESKASEYSDDLLA